MVSPAFASSARRAAILTPSPSTLNVSTMTSATWMPTRRPSGGAPLSALECARSWCSSKAQRTACRPSGNSARKPSPSARDRLRPACVGITSALAWAKKLRQRSSVRSSSRSISSAASTASATSNARRCRCAPSGLRCRHSSGSANPGTSSGRHSAISFSSAGTSCSTSARPWRSTRPWRARRENSRVTSSREVPTRLAISLCVGARSMRAALPLEALADWTPRARRTSSAHTRSGTRCAPSSSRRSASSRTEPERRRSSRSRTEG